MQERRLEARMLCADMVEAAWVVPEGSSQRGSALLEDISPSGACLQFESPIPLGAQLTWTCRGQEFAGLVQYCIFREIGYFVGVKFDAASKWSRRTYKPHHLLD